MAPSDLLFTKASLNKLVQKLAQTDLRIAIGNPASAVFSHSEGVFYRLFYVSILIFNKLCRHNKDGEKTRE